MSIRSCLVYLCLFLSSIHLGFSCGCYGKNSCTSDGIRCNDFEKTNASCLCDCYPPFNDCEQLLESNCFSNRFRTHFILSTNQSKLIANVNESINSIYIIDQLTGEKVKYLWDPCFRRKLPDGIRLTQDTDGFYKFDGMLREKLDETLFEIVFKAPTSQLISLNFTFSGFDRDFSK